MELGRLSFQPLCQALVGACGEVGTLKGSLLAEQRVESEGEALEKRPLLSWGLGVE